MAAEVLENALLLFEDIDLSGVSNTIGLDAGRETVDPTAIADTTRKSKPGLKTAGFSSEGFFDAPKDQRLWNAQSAEEHLITVVHGRSNGDTAYTFKAVSGGYSPISGATGDLAGYSLNASARGDLQRGKLLFHSDSITANGNSSALNAGAASTGVTAILHVFSVSGTNPTLDVTIESDVDSDFGDADETTQISFSQATGQTAERKTTGAVTDTWWRVTYTVGGTSPGFGFAVILVLE